MKISWNLLKISDVDPGNLLKICWSVFVDAMECNSHERNCAVKESPEIEKTLEE